MAGIANIGNLFSHGHNTEKKNTNQIVLVHIELKKNIGIKQRKPYKPYIPDPVKKMDVNITLIDTVESILNLNEILKRVVSLQLRI